MLIGYFIADREANRKGLPEGLFMDLMFYIIIASIVGARLYYVVFQWEYYSQNPLDIIMVNEGGMAIHGGSWPASCFFQVAFLESLMLPEWIINQMYIDGCLEDRPDD